MGAKLGSGGGPTADINVTPLIDVVLVLLVVFMVVTPMLQSGQPVNLPQATESTTVKDVAEHITISLTVDKGWWVEQEQVPEIEEGQPDGEALVAMVNAQFAIPGNGARSILIRGDRNLEYGEVREALDVLAENRPTTVFVATTQE